MRFVRKRLIAAIALIMVGMMLLFAAYAWQRYNQGDQSLVCLIAAILFGPLLVLKLLEPLHILLLARRVVRGFSGLSGYRRDLPKEK